jgi:hypothetical protein
MFGAEETKNLQNRHRLIAAWETKYGEPAPRVVANFLLAAPADQVIARFGNNPGPHTPPQVIGHGVNTANIGEDWLQIAGWDDGPEFGEDPKSLAEKMVPVYRKAFVNVRKRTPTPAELECVMAVGRSETLWGTAKFIGGLGPGMHNHGAVQCHQNCTDANSFQAADTHPQDSGGSVQYAQRFRKYPNDVAGAEGLIKSVGNDPLRMLDHYSNLLAAFSLGMFGNRYYEMYNATPASIAAHRATYDWILSHAKKPGVKVDEKFRVAMARAADPIWAGRVLMHSIGINKSIEATCKSLGVKRATKFSPPIVSTAEAVGAGAGAIIGLGLGGGPIGAGIGALVGLVAGRTTR